MWLGPVAGCGWRVQVCRVATGADVLTGVVQVGAKLLHGRQDDAQRTRCSAAARHSCSGSHGTGRLFQPVPAVCVPALGWTTPSSAAPAVGQAGAKRCGCGAGACVADAAVDDDAMMPARGRYSSLSCLTHTNQECWHRGARCNLLVCRAV